ncbi:hypothetical protein [Litoribacillus peritrichatus]|uniref:Uncharacterized protein n=1 Tax=Litoribacillus peritrichatus TaxID=718191 RepID=A0ABP7N3B6_9GAMM
MLWPVSFVILCLIFGAGNVYAQESMNQRLEGTYFIWSESAFDDPSRTTGMSFVIRGESAQYLYHSMPQEAVPDICLDDGSLVKQGKSVSCGKSPAGDYSCSFGLDLATETLTSGGSC